MCSSDLFPSHDMLDVGVDIGYFVEWHGFDVVGLVGCVEGFEVSVVEVVGSGNGCFEEGVWVEFVGFLGYCLVYGAGYGQLDVGVDIDFVYVVVDVFDDFFDWYVVGFFDRVVVLVDHC